jgi:hypothetical protein
MTKEAIERLAELFLKYRGEKYGFQNGYPKAFASDTGSRPTAKRIEGGDHVSVI